MEFCWNFAEVSKDFSCGSGIDILETNACHKGAPEKRSDRHDRNSLAWPRRPGGIHRSPNAWRCSCGRGEIRSSVFRLSGRNVGGAPVTAFTRIAGAQILNRSEAMQPHFVVVLDETLFGPAITDRLRPDGVILINTSNPEKYPPGPNCRIVTLDATAMAMQVLGRPIGNVAMFAALAAVSGTGRAGDGGGGCAGVPCQKRSAS